MRGLQLISHGRPDKFGLGEMDIGIDASGNPRFVSGSSRVQHDLLKGMLTGKTGDYGTLVQALVGEKQLPAVDGIVVLSIDTFVQNYRSAQASSLPDEERVVSVSQAQVSRDAGQPTRLFVQVVVGMGDGRRLMVENVFGG